MASLIRQAGVVVDTLRHDHEGLRDAARGQSPPQLVRLSPQQPAEKIFRIEGVLILPIPSHPNVALLSRELRSASRLGRCAVLQIPWNLALISDEVSRHGVKPVPGHLLRTTVSYHPLDVQLIVQFNGPIASRRCAAALAGWHPVS